MAITVNEVFRDYETDGVPSSGFHEVKKSDVRSWGAWLEGIIAAFTSSGGLIYSSKAALDADLARGANTMAWVIGDATTANNGIYRKNGASGTGSWTRVADLPFSFIIAADAGAGTPNAIQATTSIPVSGSALVWMNIFEANTASPVTVSFNGGTALTIKTNSGNDVVAGGLTDGMIVMGIVSGSTFRLVSDQASAAIVAAAEAAQAAAEVAKADAEAAAIEAEAAQAAAEAAAAGVTLPSAVASTYLRQKADASGYETKTSAEVVADLNSVPVQIAGGDSASRDAVARFGDVVDLDEFSIDGSGNTSTVAANDVAIAKWVAHMTAGGSGSGKTYRSRKARIICFSAPFTTPPNVTLRLEGCIFRYIGSSLTGFDLIHINGSDFDTVRLHLPAGSFRVRPIKVTGARGDLIDLWADSQLNNYNGSNIDWAVRLYGRNSLEQENRIGEIRIKNFNKTLGIIGDSFVKADAQVGGYVNYVRLRNYEKGVNFRNVDGMSLRGGDIRGMSSSAIVGDPGCNGILFTSAKNCRVGDFYIEDAPEHGVRCAGDDTGAEVESYNNHIHDVIIKRARQCGFKIWGGNIATKWRGGKISNITVEDAIWGNPNTTGFNYSAFLLQNFDVVTFEGLSAFGVDQAFSGREAFFIGAGSRSTLAGLRSVNGGRVNAVRFSEFNNGEADTVNNLAGNTGVKIEGLYSEGHTGDAVYIDSPSQSLRDLVVTDGNFVGGTNAFNANAIAARFAQPCVFEAVIRGHSGALSALPASANITTINKRTSVA
jgi:hypothetical protein